MAEQSHQQQRRRPGGACEECRRKRIRCDRAVPRCTACAAAGADCVVRDSLAPRGPKKGYLKTLQKRIEDLQAQLEKQQGGSTTHYSATSTADTPGAAAAAATPETRASSDSPGGDKAGGNGGGSSADNDDMRVAAMMTPDTVVSMPKWSGQVEFPFPLTYKESWDCFDSGYASCALPPPPSLSSLPSLNHLPDLVQDPRELAEPLMTPMMHNDLDQLYFDRAYVFAPILQAHRYRSWSRQPSKSRRRTCLQHAMWALASSLSSQFQAERPRLYAETRRLLDTLEVDEPLCRQVTLEQAQAWTLISLYELACHDYHRGIMSAGRAFRLIQMMRLYEVDAHRPPSTMQIESGQASSGFFKGPAQDDWVDTETRRRTFWLAYTIDRFTSMVDGMHMFFDERQIRTRLPAPEANFSSGRPVEMGFLAEAMSSPDLDEWPHDGLSSFTESVVGATLCGRVLEHKQVAPTMPCTDFCQRHGSLHALLGRHIKTLRMYASLEYPDANVAFPALAAHMAVLMLHDLVESRPLGADARATQLTQALLAEHRQQSLDAVADATLLVGVLGHHFQVHPLTPILLLLGARFSQSYPGLNNAYVKLMPGIMATLQALAGLNKLAKDFVQLLECHSINGDQCALT